MKFSLRNITIEYIQKENHSKMILDYDLNEENEEKDKKRKRKRLFNL
jgi:hypothetical protein